MTDKEKFLSILTYEEFDKRRGEFKELSMSDKDILEHASKLYTILPNGKRVIGNKKDYNR